MPAPEKSEPISLSHAAGESPSVIAVEGSCHNSRISCSSPRSRSEHTPEDTASVVSSELSTDSFTTAVKRCSNIKLEDKENHTDIDQAATEEPLNGTKRRNIKPFQNTAFQRNHNSLNLKKVNSEDLSAAELMSVSDSMRY